MDKNHILTSFVTLLPSSKLSLRSVNIVHHCEKTKTPLGLHPLAVHFS